MERSQDYVETGENIQRRKLTALSAIPLPYHRHLRDTDILRRRSELQLINRDGQLQIRQTLEQRSYKTNLSASSPCFQNTD